MKHNSIIVLMYALSAVACATNKSAENPPQPVNDNPGTANVFDPSLHAPTNSAGATQSAPAKGSGDTWSGTSTTGVDTTSTSMDTTTSGTMGTTTDSTGSATNPSGVRGSSGLEGTTPGTSRETMNARGSSSTSSNDTSSDSRNSSASSSRSTSSGSANTGTSSGSATSGSKSKDSSADTDSNKDTKSADNTKKNTRDRNDNTVTPVDQGGSEADRKITQQIRQAIVGDKSLSFNAKNVKVVTIDGKVTLRGVVKSADERDAIEAAAKKVAGVTQVDNQLEVKNK